MDNIFTLKSYIDNPLGTKTNITRANHELIEATYKQKLAVVILRENNLLQVRSYTVQTDKSYIIHIKVPSEVVENFFYDVVFKFEYYSGANTHDLTTYRCYMFSNDPNFNFRYANLFMREKILVSDLKPKIMSEAIRSRAEEINPNDAHGYIKSIYFAYLYLKQKGLFNKLRHIGAPKYNKLDLLNQIIDADAMLELRTLEKENQNKKNKIKKRVTDKDIDNLNTKRDNRNKTKVVNKIKSVGKVSKTGFINKTSKTKKK